MAAAVSEVVEIAAQAGGHLHARALLCGHLAEESARTNGLPCPSRSPRLAWLTIRRCTISSRHRCRASINRRNGSATKRRALLERRWRANRRRRTRSGSPPRTSSSGNRPISWPSTTRTWPEPCVHPRAGLPGIGVPEVAVQTGALAADVGTEIPRRYLAVPPADEILKVQLDRAQRLLSQSNITIKAIAKHCGFSMFKHFARVFRRELERRRGPSAMRTGSTAKRRHKKQLPGGRMKRRNFLKAAALGTAAGAVGSRAAGAEACPNARGRDRNVRGQPGSHSPAGA